MLCTPERSFAANISLHVSRLWICGDVSKSFGIALLGGGIIASAAAIFLPVHITKIFAGLGLEKCLGLKRGE